MNARVSGYYDYQFTGVMKQVRVNSQSINLRDLTKHGLVDVAPCSSPKVGDIIAAMQEEQEYIDSLHGAG